MSEQKEEVVIEDMLAWSRQCLLSMWKIVSRESEAVLNDSTTPEERAMNKEGKKIIEELSNRIEKGEELNNEDSIGVVIILNGSLRNLMNYLAEEQSKETVRDNCVEFDPNA